MKVAGILGLFGLVASCNVPNSSQTMNEANFSEPRALADAAVKDAQAFNQIASACEAANFDAFLTTFANSPNIRENYSSRQIAYQVGKQSSLIPADEYYQFPFTKSKDDWIGTSGFALILGAQDLQANPVIVNWSHKPLDPTLSYPENEIKLTQEKGQLEFRLVKGCWRMMADRRS